MRATTVILLQTVWLLLWAHSAQAVDQAMRLTNAAKQAWETEDFSADLSGTVSMDGPVSKVIWVSQTGQRGSGTWTMTAGKTNWSIAVVPLRLGINLISVTVVDASSHSQSIHLAINRKPVLGTQPPPQPEVRTGVWHNHPITYQLKDGIAIAEGDIVLPAETAPASAPAVTTQGLAASYTSGRWPLVSGVYQVPYAVTGTSANLSTAISKFNSQFSGLIQFITRSAQTNYVNITVGASGSGEGYSNVGMIGGPQTLTCGGSCSVATWLHEMGHTVGLLHEHQRPDRGNYITLNLANADLPNVPGNFTLPAYDYQTIGLYDYASVMHYGPFDFSKAGLPILESIPAGIPLSNSTGYSTGDIDQIKRLYSATPSSVTITTNPSGLGLVVDGTSYTAPHAFAWTLNSAHTITVAADPQYPNPADGSTYAFGNWNDRGAKSHTITVSPGPGTFTSPSSLPAITVYEANFIRLQPFAFLSPPVYPSGAGSIAVSPTPVSEFGGSFLTDRTLVQLTLTATANSGYNFYDWFNLPYPPSDNPHRFYIQSPLTQAQAVFVPTPVTIVGATLTGSNTWNPGLAGYVDGSFNFLPMAFSSTYNGTGWNGGTSHSVNAPQTQSPITTNVFYNWNNWSDGGAITHNVTQPASGSRTVSASLTPFYASYTVPPPLGSSNSACYGGVKTSPAGTSYAANTAFGFYGDGASITSTATANTSYPGMAFTGWTGSLIGTTNPNTIVIHDQFVPTALFNIGTAPLAISSLSPASAVMSTGAFNITINGTGFTSAATYVYWNGSYRSSTYVSSTQLVLHLNAGDVSHAGGQDIYVGNYSTSSSNTTCGVGTETSFTVALSGGPPSVVSVTPNSGSGVSQSFTAVYSDSQGIADLSLVKMLFNTSVNGTSSCYVLYSPGSNSLYLVNNANNGNSAAVTPGSATSVSNSQCTLSGTGSSTSRSGNNLSVTYALTFTNTFSGPKNIYLYAITNAGSPAGWTQEGTWNPASSLGAPTVVSLTPASGSGSSAIQSFTGVYSDPNGASDMNTARILLNTSVNGASGCYVYYSLAANAFYLFNDTGATASSAVTPGASSTASNSQCTLYGANSSVSKSGNNVTVTYGLKFANTFSGTKNVYLRSISNNTTESGWVQKGTFNPATSLGPPTLATLNPASGSGASQTFTAIYMDPNGNVDFNNVRLLLNTSVTSVNGCQVFYAPANNALYLLNDANSANSAGVTPGSASSVSNSQCTIHGAGSSVSKSGDNVTVAYALTFSGTFTGSKAVYMNAISNNTTTSGWVQKGVWTP